MKTEQDPTTTPKAEEAKSLHIKEAGGALVGAIGGAGLGVMAGPPGMAAGAVLGAVAGTLTAWAMATGDTEAAAEDLQLDKEIGVDGGDIGVAGLKHPPNQRGAYSAAASGAANVAPDESISAEGPIAAPPSGD
jgi:hypothetical protein